MLKDGFCPDIHSLLLRVCITLSVYYVQRWLRVLHDYPSQPSLQPSWGVLTVPSSQVRTLRTGLQRGRWSKGAQLINGRFIF